MPNIFDQFDEPARTGPTATSGRPGNIFDQFDADKALPESSSGSQSAITGPYVPFVDDAGVRVPQPGVSFDPGAGSFGETPPEAMQAGSIGTAAGMPDKASEYAHSTGQAMKEAVATLPLIPIGSGAYSAPGLIGKMGQGALVGSGGGALYGVATGEGDAGERLERGFEFGKIGAATGLLLPPVMSGIGKVLQGGRGLINAVTGRGNMKGFTKAEQQSLRTIFKAFADDGIGPDETLQRLRTWRANGGAPAQLIDLGGPNVQRLARAIGTVGGPGATKVANEAERRLAMQADEISSALAKTLSRKTDYLATIDELMAMRQGMADPLYKRAMNAGPIHTDRLAQFVDDPIAQSGLKRGLEIQRLEALANKQPFNPKDAAIVGFNEAGDPIIGGVPNMRTYDAIKRGMDAIIKDERNAITGQLSDRGRAVKLAKDAFVRELDDLNPVYAEARRIWAGHSESMEAMEAGKNIFKGDFIGVQKQMRDMTPGEREFARAGAVQAIRDKIDRVVDSGNKASAILKTENLRKRLRLLFDDDASFRRFETMIQQEADRIDRAQFMRPDIGSQTTPRKEDVFRYGLKSQALEDVRSGSPVRSFIGGIGRRVTDPFINAAQQSRADARGAAIADMLFSNPRRAGIIRALAQNAPPLPVPGASALALAGTVPAIGRAMSDDPQRRKLVRALAGQ